MAEDKRLTKKERRERAREERRKAEEKAKAKAAKQRLRTTLISILVIAAVAAVVGLAFFGGPEEIDDTIVLGASDVADAEAAAGCEVEVAGEPLPDATHYEAATAPPADVLYPGIRPTHSGPHYAQFHPPVRDGSDTQLDERATTHNLEHGAIIAWYDPEQVDGATIGEMEAWSEKLNAAGFTVSRAGTNVFVSPYTEPGITSGKAIAFRAWGWAVDCDSFDETMANGFVLDHWGTHGMAPERGFAPFPENLMRYAEDDAPAGGFEGENAPTTDRHGGDEDTGGTTETDTTEDG